MRTTPFVIAPDVPARGAPVTAQELVEDAVLEDRFTEDADLAGSTARLVELAGCSWHRVGVGRGDWRRATLADQEFTDCDLGLLRADEASVRQSRFVRSRLSGSVWSGGGWQFVELTDCPADLAGWRHARLDRVRITRCRLTGADFSGARLERVEFVDCDLSEAEFAEADVVSARFEDCRLDGATGLASLRRATFAFTDPSDALGLLAPLADGLGITVEYGARGD